MQDEFVIFVLTAGNDKTFDAVLASEDVVNKPTALVREKLAEILSSMPEFDGCRVGQNSIVVYKPSPDAQIRDNQNIFEPSDNLPALDRFDGSFTPEFIEKLKAAERRRRKSGGFVQLQHAPVKAWNAMAGKKVDKGGLFTVYHLREAGLTHAGHIGDDSFPAFARNEAIGLFRNVLEALEKKMNVLVTGPPGCGKSLIMWQLACHLARHDCCCAGKNGIIWIRLIKGESVPPVVSLLTTSGIRFTILAEADIIESVLEEVSPWLVVLDGVSSVTKNIQGKVGRWCYVNCRRFLFVNSPQTWMRPEEQRAHRAETFRLYAWEESDLRTAFNDKLFYRNVSDNFEFSEDDVNVLNLDRSKLKNADYLFRAKFMLAGHSARWMFDEKPSALRKQIWSHISKTSLNFAWKDENEAEACNYLFCSLQPSSIETHQTIATSAYILANFLKRGDSDEGKKFLKFLTVFSRTLGDTGFDGIVLELDFRAELVGCEETQNKINLLDGSSNERVSWGVTKLVPLHQGNDSVDLTDCLLSENVWLVPVNWQNCPSFDFVGISPAVSKNDGYVGVNLRIVQITKANRHEFNYDHVTNLINRLEPAKAKQVETCSVFVIHRAGSEQPKMITKDSDRTGCKWKWGHYIYLQFERKELGPMDILASLQLKRW